jgi:hypothetical protein
LIRPAFRGFASVAYSAMLQAGNFGRIAVIASMQYRGSHLNKEKTESFKLKAELQREWATGPFCL